MTRGHAEISASVLERILECTGSVPLSRGIPEPPQSVQAEEGEQGHEVAETYLKHFLQHKKDGTPIPVMDADPDMLDGAEMYRKVIWEELLEKTITGKACGFENKLTVNKKFNMYGYADFWAVFLNDKGNYVAVIADYKYGFYPKDAENNPQLAFYAVGLRNEIRERKIEISEVKVAIVQPRRLDGQYWSSYTFNTKALDKWEKKINTLGREIYLQSIYKYKAGDHCKFCKAQGKCKTYSEYLKDSTSLEIFDFNNSPLPATHSLTDDQISRLLTYEDAVLNFFKKLKGYVMSRAETGDVLKGWKLVDGPQRRKWKDEEEALERLTAIVGNEDLVANVKVKGIGDIEKLLKKKLALEQVSATMSSLTVKTSSSLLLVPDTDGRDSVKLLIDKM